MKSRQYWWAMLVLMGVLLVTRFYQLGVVPAGMAWDEAAIGYNGWSIWHTFRDEWLIKLPISFKSFGDFKAPLAIYLNGLFTMFFGLNLWAIRIPFALFGLFAVIGLIILVKLIWPSSSESMKAWYGWGAGLLLTTSPWHHHFSRAAFESGMALGLLIWGFVGLEWVKSHHHSLKTTLVRMSALCLLALTLYTYHSNKLVTPLLLAYWLWLNRPTIVDRVRTWFVSLLAMLVVLLPFLYDSFFGEGLTRAGVNLFAQLPFPSALIQMIKNFFMHLSPNFLLFGETTSLRHGDGKSGVLLATTFVLLLIGLTSRWWVKFSKITNYFYRLAIGWLLIGLLPAALGSDVPHSNRALQALPGFLMLALLGVGQLFNHKPFKSHVRVMLFSLVGVHLALFAIYLNHYYHQYNLDSAADFQFGYDQAFATTEEYLKGNEQNPAVDRVVMSNAYGQPYIYALIYKQVSPYQYHNGVLSLYEFKDQVDIGDLARKNTLVVATTNDQIAGATPDLIIYNQAGQGRFFFYRTR